MTKSDFKYDEQGRTILGSAEEMAAWVRFGFEEQDKRRNTDIPFYQNYIDLRKCDLYTSKTSSSPIFNIYELAGVVPGIVKIENDPNYLYEVKLDIFLNGSILRGNFFHYVKFNGKVGMDEVVVDNTFSCLRCLFDGFVYMQGIHLKSGYTFEQCVFNKGLVMTSAVIGGINAEFNYCIFKDRISLAGTSFAKTKDYSQSINLSNSTVENLNISRVKTDGIPLYIQNSSINGMKMNNMAIDGVIDFNSCALDGIITSVIDEDQPNNVVRELKFHNCQLKAQYHMK